ncbi:MAG TPA: hypothetical protein VFD32_24290 [Dehalococcoidia bacterium]|nr:hypothetical protein [Dehalococcoidia bacterium]
MTVDPPDNSLVISDWDGNFYRIPRAVLQQYRIENPEHLPEASRGRSSPAAWPIHWWQSRRAGKRGNARPPGRPTG